MNAIEKYVEEVVVRELEKRESVLKEEDANAIINAIIPEIEKIVAKVVIKHFQAIAVYVQANLKSLEG